MKTITYYTGFKKLNISKASSPILDARGFFEKRIITEWKEIIGESYYQNCIPQRITTTKIGDQQYKGILHLDTCDLGILADFSYLKAILIERITRYFGYKAINDIYIKRKSFIPQKRTSPKEAKVIDNKAKDQYLHMIEKKYQLKDKKIANLLSDIGALIT